MCITTVLSNLMKGFGSFFFFFLAPCSITYFVLTGRGEDSHFIMLTKWMAEGVLGNSFIVKQVSRPLR
jgi:hypothetical protein